MVLVRLTGLSFPWQSLCLTFTKPELPCHSNHLAFRLCPYWHEMAFTLPAVMFANDLMVVGWISSGKAHLLFLDLSGFLLKLSAINRSPMNFDEASSTKALGPPLLTPSACYVHPTGQKPKEPKFKGINNLEKLKTFASINADCTPS